MGVVTLQCCELITVKPTFAYVALGSDAVIHDSRAGTNFYIFPMTGVVTAAAVQLPKMTGSNGRLCPVVDYVKQGHQSIGDSHIPWGLAASIAEECFT
jgi:hypothetical protein